MEREIITWCRDFSANFYQLFFSLGKEIGAEIGRFANLKKKNEAGRHVKFEKKLRENVYFFQYEYSILLHLLKHVIIYNRLIASNEQSFQ